MEGSDPDSYAEVVGVLTVAVSTTNEAAEFAGVLGVALTAFADRIGSGVGCSVLTGPAPAPPVPARALPPPGRYKDKTRREHVLNKGVEIGRPAHGKKKMPIRLVDSVEELDEVFNALHVGAEPEIIPGYKGRVYRFPDDTRIAYRTHSLSGGDDDPTLDLSVRGTVKMTLKVHVEPEQGGTP